MKPFFCLIPLLIVVSGCAAPSQIMMNPTTKHQVNCSTWGFGWLGTPIAIANYQECVSKYKTLGYIPIEEVEKNEPPKLDKQAEVEASPCLRPVWAENSEWRFLVNGREGYLKVLGKENFKGHTVYRVINGPGNFLLFNEALGVAARLNKDGNIEVEYTPPLMPYDWPLSVGKTWNATGTMETSKGSTNLSTYYEVKGYGKIKVPAGNFDTYYLVGKSDRGARVVELWYSPEVKYYVKAVSYRQTGTVLEELTSYSHPKLNTSTTAPKKVEIEEKIETLNDTSNVQSSATKPVEGEGKEKLKRLEAMKALGLLSQEEFKKEKAKIEGASK